MTNLTIDDSLFSRLRTMYEPIAIRDSAGNLVGHFVPAAPPAEADRLPKISEAEMDEREHQGGGRSLTEILADLEKLA